MAVKISINGEGLTYERETDLQKAGQIITFLNSESLQSGNNTRYSNSTDSGMSSGLLGSRQSPRQALLGSDAKTNIEKMVVLADFVCRRDGITAFSPKEIQIEFKKAGEPLPKNFTRDFSKAIQQGYVLEGEEKGTYNLTDLATDALRDGFSTQQSITMTTSSRKKKRGSKGGSKGAIIRDDVTKLEITPSLEGYAGYWEIAIKGMRILWLLAYADEHGVSTGLTSAEISYLSSKLKDQIKTGDFSALVSNNIKKGYMVSNSSSGLNKILKPGVDTLKELKK